MARTYKKQKLKINMALFRKKTKKKTSGTNWCYFPVSDAYLACTTDFEKCGKVVCTQTTGKKSIAKYPDSENSIARLPRVALNFSNDVFVGKF